MTEGPESSTGLNFVDIGQEDIAWADSCLINDPDSWDSLKAALLEALDSHNHSSPYERENATEEDKMEISSSGNTGNIRNVDEKTSTRYHFSPYDRLQPLAKEIRSSEDINDVHDLDDSHVSIASTSEGGPETNIDDRLNQDNAEDFWSKHKVEDVFLPTYNENLRDLGVSDPEEDFVFQEIQLDQSSEDIFKVWDFDISPEENDLTKQLNKVLAENPLEETPLISEAQKPLQDEGSLDDLISGIADLALSPKPDFSMLM